MRTHIGFTVPTDGSACHALQYGGSRFLGGYPNDGVTAVDQETLEAKTRHEYVGQQGFPEVPE